MVRNRWIVLVVAVAILVAISTAPLAAAQRMDGQQTASVVALQADADAGSWSGTWLSQAWNWLVALFQAENGSIVP